MARKWSRTTKGQNQQVFVSKPINYSTQATYAAFQANAAVGEIGLFDATTPNPVLIPVSLLAAGAKFFIAQKQTVGIKRSPTYINGSGFEVTPRKVLYTAPVNQQSAIGWNGSGGAFNNPTIVPGTSNYEFAVLEMTEGNDPYPVWNYNYTPKASDSVVEITGQLAKLVNDTTNPVYKNNLPVVTAQSRTNGTITAPYTMTGTTPTLTFTLGSNIALMGGTTPALVGATIGDYLIFFAGTGVPDNTNNDTYKLMVHTAGVSIQLDRPWGNPTAIITGANVPTFIKKTASVTAIGLILNAINNNETFRLAVRGDLVGADRFEPVSYTRGSGTYAEIAELEAEGFLMQGQTARNTVFGDAAFGPPDIFALSTDTYDYFYFDVLRRVTLTNSFNEGVNRAQLVIAAARSAGNLKAQLQTIFGV